MTDFPYGRVRITKPDHPYAGHSGEVMMVYYDRCHKGDDTAVDLLYIRLDSGETPRPFEVKAYSNEVEELREVLRPQTARRTAP